MLITKGINKIYYLEDKNQNSPSNKASKILLKAAGIKVKKIKLSKKSANYVEDFLKNALSK